jgi:hypothetical protein
LVYSKGNPWQLITNKLNKLIHLLITKNHWKLYISWK